MKLLIVSKKQSEADKIGELAVRLGFKTIAYCDHSRIYSAFNGYFDAVLVCDYDSKNGVVPSQVANAWEVVELNTLTAAIFRTGRVFKPGPAPSDWIPNSEESFKKIFHDVQSHESRQP